MFFLKKQFLFSQLNWKSLISFCVNVLPSRITESPHHCSRFALHSKSKTPVESFWSLWSLGDFANHSDRKWSASTPLKSASTCLGFPNFIFWWLHVDLRPFSYWIIRLFFFVFVFLRKAQTVQIFFWSVDETVKMILSSLWLKSCKMLFL